MADSTGTPCDAVLYRWAPAWGLPSISVPCLQVEAYLRLGKVAFAVQDCAAPSASPTGQLPALDTSADLVGAHAAVSGSAPPPLAEFAAARQLIDYLKRKVVDLDRGLTASQRAEAAAYAALVEAKLQPALVFTTWCEAGPYGAHTRPAYGAGLPFPLSRLAPRAARAAALRHFGGEGAAAAVYGGAAEALDALGARLAATTSGDYFFGGQPSSLDALLYGCLAYLRSAPVVHPQLGARLGAHRSLGAYVERLSGVAFEAPAPAAADAELDWSAWGAAADDKYSKARTEKESELQRKGRRWLLCAGAAIAAYVFLSGQYLQLQLGGFEFEEEEEEEDATVAHSACCPISSRGAPAPRALPPSPSSRRLAVRPRASGEGGGDVDEAWRRFQRRSGFKLPEVERQNVRTQAPPRFTNRSGEWNSGPTGDQLRRQERAVLDAWTQALQLQLAAGGTIVVVLLLLFAAGGPPSDARCTLPWC
ncbi:metaxin-1 isoform X2 [Micractinium conductrix]|uniref:Metaxin-1 isoform X2 n=1 Tax=Micractinium conductrix TaxID=554055 RepID=A0A2P6VHY6_9CHLO|nr:metaxin-1 isoform X2 [Micractinium conductrix]|eukprot:PSC73709.1 metaxin-1 isoform X2 [Micractinium conductrix]